MKKTRSLMLLIASLFALTVSAQGIIVHQGNSKKIEFKSKDVQKIEFTDNQVENTIDNYVEKSALDEKQSELDKALGKISELSDLIKELQAKIDAGGGTGGGSDDDPYNGHEYVDLGLSVKWATMNVGATEVAGSKTNSHTGQLDCYGEYYAWGETSPKDEYTWKNLKYCSDPDKLKFSKYVASSSYGTVDDKTTLELSDDAARANWGGSWRMPTKAELDELRTKCTWTWTTMDGVKGYKVSASNGNYIFLPASGCRSDSSFSNVGSYGYYWSGSLYTDYSDCAYELGFLSDDVDMGNFSRYGGQSARAVCP